MRTFQQLIKASVAEKSSLKNGSSSATVDFEGFNSALRNSVAGQAVLANELSSLTEAQKIMLYQTISTESFAPTDKISIATEDNSTNSSIQYGTVNYPVGYKERVNATFESFANANQANTYAEIFSSLNVGAALQEPFAECFFTTTPIKREEAGKVFEVAVPYRYDGVLASDFSPTSFFDKAVNLVDAMYTPEIVFSSSTRLQPQRTTSKLSIDNTANYMAETVGVYWPGVTNSTLAVKPIISGKTIDLFDTDANTSSPAIEDALDSVSPALTIEKLVFKNDLGGAAPVTGAIFAIDTRNTAGAQIVKNVTGGNESDYTLNLKGSIFLSSKTMNLAGTRLFASDILDDNTFVEIEYSAAGSINLRNRKLKVTVDAPTVKRAFTVINGAQTAVALTATGNGQKIATIVTFFAGMENAAGKTGYWPNGTRANGVARVAGILVDYKLSKWSAAVDFGSPISVVGSLLEAAQTGSAENNVETKVETMRQAGYSVISGQAVQRLLEHASVLEARYGVAGTVQYVRTRNDFDVPSAHFCMPYFKRATVDATLIINSIKSSEKMMDIQAALLNFIRQEAYDMIRNSRIRAAWDIHNPGKNINVKIGTDTVISRYIIQSGDIRTLGSNVDCEIVATDNLAMKDKIIITIGLPSEQSSAEDIMSFGKHFIAPETIFEINDSLASTFGGIKRTTWYPRNRHVPMLNVMVVLDIDHAAFVGAISLATAYQQV